MHFGGGHTKAFFFVKNVQISSTLHKYGYQKGIHKYIVKYAIPYTYTQYISRITDGTYLTGFDSMRFDLNLHRDSFPGSYMKMYFWQILY